MERITAAARTAADNGHGTVSGEILWQESCVLGMGQVHGMEIPRRNKHLKPENVQAYGSRRGSSGTMSVKHDSGQLTYLSIGVRGVQFYTISNYFMGRIMYILGSTSVHWAQ